MKNLLLPFVLVAWGSFTIATGASETTSENTAPHLEMRHGVRQLVVDGKPFLILGGELHNSSSSSREYMKSIWPRLVEKNLNTVLAAVTWELTEPEEGRFDFSVVDDLIADARQNHLHLVFLWFASWKNGQSSYAPYWVKTDSQRFPLVQDGWGKNLNILSTFGAATRDADARAFAALMRHIREVDGAQHTVLMVQVENESGILGDSRDRSAVANAAFAGPVPQELMSYLQLHKETLAPELREAWAANGFKTSGTWTDVFGESKPADLALSYNLTDEQRATEWRKLHWPADEIFMAWHYSQYIEKVAEAGKREYDIPMYCNAWLQQPSLPWPGTYPSGGAVPQVHDIWRAGAPDIDILSPDLYVAEFDEVCQKFTRNGNPLFIPEANTGDQAAKNVLDAVLNHNAIGFSPFGIDGWRRPPMNVPPTNPAPTNAAPTNAVPANVATASAAPPVDSLAETYAVLDYLAPEILAAQGGDKIAFLAPADGANDPPQEVKLGNYTLTISFGGDQRARRANNPAFSMPPPVTNSFPSRLVIASGPDEYIFVGGGMNVTFAANAPGPQTVRLASFDESILADGRWVPGRRLNGDETGHNTRWPFMRNFGIYRIKVYRQD